MFIIPVGNRVNWKKPPVITLLIILINCFVFFGLQGNDQREEAKAADYYFSSDLPDWELNRYAEFLESGNDSSKAAVFQNMLDEQNGAVLMIMEGDLKFMHELHAGNIIKAGESNFSAWSQQRKKYESMRSFTTRHVYHVDHPTLITTLSSAFMHAGLDHLFGNMVVLFLIGFLVESVIGKSLFIMAYLASTFAAIFVFSLTSSSGAGYLGASGAIAGVMGLYTVIFGFRKIDFFYSLGFYFDYVRAPAILLLPLWLGNELYQHLTDHVGHVAYMAHFGGLLGGAIIGISYRLMKPAIIESHHQVADSKEMDAKEFKRGMDYLGAMEFKKALGIFKLLQAKHPDDINLMRLTYLAAKADSASQEYHEAALKLLTLHQLDAETSKQIHNVFHEYMGSAKPAPRLSEDLIAKLAKRFAGEGQLADAEKLVSQLSQMNPLYKELPSVILAVARGYYREQRKDKFNAMLQSLMQQFPDSKEAEIAKDLLRMA